MNILEKLNSKIKNSLNKDKSQVVDVKISTQESEFKYKLKPDQILKLIDSTEGCIASNRITIDGCKVGFMYREEPYRNSWPDTGWRFMAGDESDEYMGNAMNHNIYQVNTICNYDHDIIPFLDSKPGSAYIRNKDGVLVFDEECNSITE